MYILKKRDSDIYVKNIEPTTNKFVHTKHKHEAEPFNNKPVYVLNWYDKDKQYEIVNAHSLNG